MNADDAIYSLAGQRVAADTRTILLEAVSLCQRLNCYMGTVPLILRLT
jgi:hypothetical protein